MSDLINKKDAIIVCYKIVEELAESSLSWDALKLWVKEQFNSIPSEQKKISGFQ